MIFYGTNSSRLKDGQISNVTCPNCENLTSMTYSVFGKYAYLYWVPVFPIGKVNVLECNHCKRTYDLKELPEQIKRKFEIEKHNGIPILHFSGLAVIACIIGYFSFASSNEKKEEAIFSKNPKINDVYYVEAFTKGRYTSMKVTDVINDSVYVVFNDYEIDRRYQVDDIDISENYTTATDKYSIEEIIDLFNEDIIFDIERD
jgi:hypothetical protein